MQSAPAVGISVAALLPMIVRGVVTAMFVGAALNASLTTTTPLEFFLAIVTPF